VEVQDRHDRRARPDEPAYIGEEGAFGIGLVLGDHRPVEKEDDRRERPGAARGRPQPVEEPGPQGLMGVGGDQPAGHGGGKEGRNQIGAGIGGGGEDTAKNPCRTGALGENRLSRQKGALAERGQVGRDGREGIRFMPDTADGDPWRKQPGGHGGPGRPAGRGVLGSVHVTLRRRDCPAQRAAGSVSMQGHWQPEANHPRDYASSRA
jgi:hypothetical protein